MGDERDSQPVNKKGIIINGSVPDTRIGGLGVLNEVQEVDRGRVWAGPRKGVVASSQRAWAVLSYWEIDFRRIQVEWS